LTRDGKTIALVGGGRWGRVHASNLAQLLTSRDRVLWVSRHNQGAVREAIARFSEGGPKFELVSGQDDALAERPDAALVVTAPDTHFTVAGSCLRTSIHTFVEKPLAFKSSDARSLIETAANADVMLAVGVHLLSASYLHHFKKQLASRRIESISIRWFDPVHEVRYGEDKRAPDSVPLAHDIYPHLWSIARVLTDNGLQVITRAAREFDGSIVFESSAGSVKIDARCDRNASARERKISVVFQDGEIAGLDFTGEPGIGWLGREALSSDPQWGTTPRPAMAEVQAFLLQTSSPIRDPQWPHLAVNCLDSVTGAEALDAALTCGHSDISHIGGNYSGY
jgi:predicted dehydrogenase